MYRIIAEDGRAKRAELITPDGTVETPVFMNVATCAAIKGALTPLDLREAGCQIALCNAYHLHVRPGEEIIESFGGIKKFMAWDSPVLTDSGGYQIHSLSKLRKIKEEGVYFNSHTDGRKIFMGPEESAEIQYKLGSTIAMRSTNARPTTPNANTSSNRLSGRPDGSSVLLSAIRKYEKMKKNSSSSESAREVLTAGYAPSTPGKSPRRSLTATPSAGSQSANPRIKCTAPSRKRSRAFRETSLPT